MTDIGHKLCTVLLDNLWGGGVKKGWGRLIMDTNYTLFFSIIFWWRSKERLGMTDLGHKLHTVLLENLWGGGVKKGWG